MSFIYPKINSNVLEKYQINYRQYIICSYIESESNISLADLSNMYTQILERQIVFNLDCVNLLKKGIIKIVENNPCFVLSTLWGNIKKDNEDMNNNPKDTSKLEKEFEDIWNKYPGKKRAKASAKKHFLKKIKTEKELNLFKYGLDKYINDSKMSPNYENYLYYLRTFISEEIYKDYEEDYNIKNNRIDLGLKPTYCIVDEANTFEDISNKNMNYDDEGNLIL